MGWLYMRSLEGHATPKAYLDAQFTYDRDTGRSRVLASSLVGRRTYYAAVEWIPTASGEREVWGLICLVRYNPRDREGLVFGYKDMSESMGPCESECPGRILDLLTATENTYALAWGGIAVLVAAGLAMLHSQRLRSSAALKRWMVIHEPVNRFDYD